jgi:O-acetyl-ADP-ribose deacetylase (regulator of RNase III)
LLLATKNEVRKISFPNISTGVYNFPKSEAANIAVSVVKNFMKSNSVVNEVIFVCFDDENYVLYESLLKQLN